MKKFSQYLAPKEKEKNLSLTEKVWLEAKKKAEAEAGCKTKKTPRRKND